MSAEVWRPVVGFESRYIVSNHGRVKALERVVVRSTSKPYTVPECFIKTPPNKYGYPECAPQTKGNVRTRLVHQMVLEAFVGPAKPGQVCRHLDGNPGNSRLDNLAWGTMAENSQDTIRHGRVKRGEDVHSAKLTEAQVTAIRADSRPQQSIARDYGVTQAHVSRIKSGERWAHA
jgi:HNH endonuclease/NUMOD4 motif